MRGLFSWSILTWSMMNSVSLGNLFVTMLDVREFQCPVSLHGCVLNPFCPCFSGLSCPILTGYLRIKSRRALKLLSQKESSAVVLFPIQRNAW